MTLQNSARQIEEREMGDIRFSCSECGTRLLADEVDAGGQAECPKCAATVGIPGEPPIPPAPQEKPYFIYKNGQQLGPYSLNQVTSMISQGQLSGTDWAWTEGMDNWKPVSMTPGIVLPQWKPAQTSSSTPSRLANEVENMFPDADASPSSEMESLPVSDSWKKIFNLIEEAGGYVWSWQLYHLKYPKALTWKERMKVGFSLWGALFGPFYYLVKRMWVKALIYAAIVVALLTLLELLTGYEFRYSGMVPFALLAKWDYYLLKVKKKQLW
jgi:hypothetical protein